MDKLYKKAIEAYIKMFEIHINTKTTDIVFHKETENFYEKLFDISHQIGEKYVDLDGKLNNMSISDQKIKANQIIKELREEVEKYKEQNNITLGTEDMLGTIASDLEDIEGTSKSFLN